MKANAQVLQNGPHATPSYGLIGDGRLARHLAHYFLLLQLPLKRWSRRLSKEQGISWKESLADSSVILLAVSDSAIDSLAEEIRKTPGFETRTLIHFSGALSTQHAWGFHPLMGFAATLFPLEIYEQIPWIMDEGAPSVKEVFPKFKNPSARISPEKKALYHAWCVMGGNFTAFLWTRMFETFSNDLGLDSKLAIPYLKQLTATALAQPKNLRGAWTGPIVRGDLTTIEQNQKALEGDPYQEVYEAFVRAHLPLSKDPEGPT